MIMTDYHKPVLLEESVQQLVLDPEGNYADLTFGGGGHSSAILDRLGSGKLIAFDQDGDAQQNALLDDRFRLVKANFKYLKNFCRMHGMLPLSGILADLGVSSHQFDVPDRGFSFRFEADLDMRMDIQSKRTAADVLNTYEPVHLMRLLRDYGELKQAQKIADRIVSHRTTESINTVGTLKQILQGLVPSNKENQFLAQVFQALRIEVNQELEALKEMLNQADEVLVQGGRLVVISYHSLEDRLVKNFFKTGNFEGEPQKDFYGNLQRPLRPLSNKIIRPSEVEISENPRSRSAKLRIAEKL